ncbi:hypothetical protein A6A06_28110 [Streptomyces sp. CB02923]|uniref:hypothetical protein n=1 Tax=Streptomyces sp. CB02923 TaxID=1718985 RepID=UPI0009402DAB|nr:hypothetical protein [Streptomyces sp. CB02923]OKH98093.1 hypothetical protein A6A06_28110 [Streptomyces sp. CB02923]
MGALDRAEAVERAARARSGWYARYLWGYAAGQLVLVPVALLWHGVAAASVLTLTNVALATGLSVYAARQRIVPRGFGARHGVLMGCWGAAYTAALLLGNLAFPDSRVYAAVAAPACALPLAVGAVLERRRSS